MFEFGFDCAVYHLEAAEMTSELRDDLIKFSFDNLYDALKNSHRLYPNVRYSILFLARSFLAALKKLVCLHFHPYILCIFTYSLIQPLSGADHICQTLQVDFDRIFCNILGQYHSFPGFTPLLGSLLQCASAKRPHTLLPGIVASCHLIRKQGEGDILNDIGLVGMPVTYSRIPAPQNETLEFIAYFAEFLENPERSGTCFFDEQKYRTAAKECLQLYLGNHRNFSKGAAQFAHRDRALRRSKPFAWIVRLGVHSRIWKARHHFKVQLHKPFKARINQYDSFFENAPLYEYYRSFTYRGALDLLPFFLEKSGVSLELADALRSNRFTTMAWEFPRRMRFAKEAIKKYLLRVESAGDNS